MISFVIPIYIHDEFVGVVGMDFDYHILLDKVRNIRVYENGYAHLEKDGEILYYDAENTANEKMESHPGDFQVVSRLRNGMDLVVTADHDDIAGIRRQVLLQLIITTVVITAALAGIAILLVQKIVRPIKNLTEAAEKLAKNDYHINICQSNTKEIIQLNATFQHMTEQLREREKLQQMLAYRDALTGLRNTTAYKAWISEFDKQRHENTLEFGVVVLDINFLKEANDRYGHDVGNQLIIKAARIRQDFTANVSHELKTPITAISGYAELIENRLIDSEAEVHVAGAIRHNADRLLSLVTDIIQLSELDHRELPRKFEQIDLLAVAKECVNDFIPMASQKNIKLFCSGISAGINADRILVREMIDNLLQNAIRYNKENGTVKVHVTIENGHPIISVEDTGIGIPADQLDRVFERFYRVDKSRSRETGGTGLGLAIVKHIAELHSAEIAIDSVVNNGTKISIRF
jgi:signal transduction histidine kinase